MREFAMHPSSVRIGAAALLLVVVVFALAWLPAARSQIQVGPSYIPIGVASTGNSSTVWFHEPSSGRALACQSVHGGGAGISGIQCVAGKLP
jgi:hypothetical protein